MSVINRASWITRSKISRFFRPAGFNADAYLRMMNGQREKGLTLPVTQSHSFFSWQEAVILMIEMSAPQGERMGAVISVTVDSWLSIAEFSVSVS